MWVFFSLPFIGLVLGWFFVGAFISAPASIELMQAGNGYRIGLIAVAALGVLLMAVTAVLEMRLRETLQNVVARFLVSFFSIVIGFCLGFAPPFLLLLAYAEPAV